MEKKTILYSFTAVREDMLELKAISKSLDMSVSQILRILVKKYVKNYAENFNHE